jgi:hypothetical protein
MIVQIEPGDIDQNLKAKDWIMHTDIYAETISDLNKISKELLDFAYKYDMEPFSEPEVDTFERWGDSSITLSVRVRTIKHLPKKSPEGVFIYEKNY